MAESGDNPAAGAWDEKAVFLEALALPASERDAFLRRHCPDEAAKARIETLLLHHDEAADDFLTVTMPPAEAPGQPTTIDEFNVIRRLGEGGMGIVYLAEDTILGRRVALKVLARHLTGSEQALARFREEARSTAALKHPAIVPIFKFGRSGDDYYLVSEYVEGPTLAQLISETRVRFERFGTQNIQEWHRRAAQILATVADALDCAHRANIVHRDVKPSNILIDPVHGPRLTDFGIAKHLTEEDRTQTSLVGSCHYMSPEQADIAGSRIDQRSDVFSLGVVLYETLVLRLPFNGPSLGQILRAVSECNPVRLRALDKRIPRDLETITHKALEKRPQDRYQRAAHVAADLRCSLDGDPILARPPGPIRRMRRFIYKRRTAALVALMIVLAIGILAPVWLLRKSAEASQAWVSVDADKAGCRVLVQRIDAETFEVRSEVVFSGSTPLSELALSAGQYRVTVKSAEDRGFAEFNAILLRPGRDSGTSFRVQHRREPNDSKNENLSPTALYAVLAPSSGATIENMQLIKAGRYPYGRLDFAGPLTRPRRVQLPAFFIDTREVSNAEYKQFVEDTGYPTPKFWQRFGYDAGLADRPIVGIRLDDAEAYARWCGKRLPTLNEWQAAARGPQGHLHPWGDAPAPEAPAYDPGLLLDDQAADFETHYRLYRRQTVDCTTGSVFTDSPALTQIFGNVREITGSIVLERVDGVALGRCWIDPPKSASLTDNWSFPLDTESLKHGFRCAKSAAAPGLQNREEQSS
ncbi:MAG TPA: bifunctional serine/threonine-protein kinase/formylglycine-generating enzyme family protein [Phycisphaerae bacterium]|nr:bifunctional serine/threonine-protein kinase/formylglycine-generating enzyme family protein [Phycisphaerae bacterium]